MIKVYWATVWVLSVYLVVNAILTMTGLRPELRLALAPLTIICGFGWAFVVWKLSRHMKAS